jgi:Pre-mRNA cleavage complex II protein Clp1
MCECRRADDEITQADQSTLISSDIDAQRKKMTVLSPMPGKLPSKTALLGVSATHDLLLYELVQ